LELMTRQDFVILAEQPGTEIVVGTIGQFWAGRSVMFRGPAGFRAFRDPRFAKVAMNFRVIDEGNGWCKVTTETRVACPDPRARRKFDEYWRVIYPGSSIIRAQWLQAVKRRAERPTVVDTPTSMESRHSRPAPGTDVLEASLQHLMHYDACVALPFGFLGESHFKSEIQCMHMNACEFGIPSGARRDLIL